MPGVEDASMTRMIQKEIGRRPIDITRLDVMVTHGVVHLRGQIKKLRGHDVDLKHELEIMRRIIHSKPGIREVLVDDVIIVN